MVRSDSTPDKATGAHGLGVARCVDLRPGERWYVAQTRAQGEGGAEMQLARQGFRPFLPRLRKTVRHARKLRTVLAPVFPGYLFIPLDIDRDRWRSVNGTFGVARLISACDHPTPAPRGTVEALIAASDSQGLLRFDQGLQPGQKVQVISGPFAHSIGDLERLDGAGRVRVLLEIMGGQVPIMIDRASIRAA